MRFVVAIVSLSFFIGCQTFQRSADSAEPQAQARWLASGERLDSSGYAYDPRDTSCDGFPKLKVETPPGTCLGLVMPRERAIDTPSGKKFVKPRVAVQVPGTQDFLITDMGGWAPGRGLLFWMKLETTGQYTLRLVKSGLNLPHGLAFHNGRFYIGETTQISRFSFANGQVSNWEIAVGNFRGERDSLHPLSHFQFDRSSGDLYINVGAPSDHCFVSYSGDRPECPEDSNYGEGAIYKIPAAAFSRIPQGGIRDRQLVARGLRNSMAMAIHPSGNLIQGENSRDFPELEEPYEELNVINLREPEFHYGWPYCYDFHALSPEWRMENLRRGAPNRLVERFNWVVPIDCNETNMVLVNRYKSPHALIPPHAAPLSAVYYNGTMFRDLDGKLLMTWHGYRPTGHRLVAYNVDENGIPLSDRNVANAKYGFDQPTGCPGQKPFRPQGGINRHSPYTELISKWYKVEGVRPIGTPVGVTVAEDGSLFIVEDGGKEKPEKPVGRSVVRLARTTSSSYVENCSALSQNTNDPRIELLAWRHAIKSNAALQAKYIEVNQRSFSRYCSKCHGGAETNEIAQDRFNTLDHLIKNQWIVPGDAANSKFIEAMARSGTVLPMPPAGEPQIQGSADGAQIIQLVSEWISSLPTDVNTRFARQIIRDARKVRNRPTVEGSTVCGQVAAGESVYIDPRNSAIVPADGWSWVKAYFVPRHSSLVPNACPYPEDGVFYIALRRLQ